MLEKQGGLFMRKYIAMVFILCLALTTNVWAYEDTEDHWAKDEISEWSARGILMGSENAFRPNDPITRGEMAVILDRVMGYEVQSDKQFIDLGEAFYKEAMLGANASGIILGSFNTIRPMDAITREEAIVMFCRVLGLDTATTTADIKFADNGEISSWALPSVYAMENRGYIKGDEFGNFAPKKNMTRGEVVKLLDNTIENLQNKAEVVSQTVNGNMVVNVSGVKLKDMTIKGDLILSEGIGNGEITLDTVTVTGRTVIRGGGANSINIDGKSSLGPAVVEKIGSSVAVKVGKDASVVSIQVKTHGAKITAPSTKVVVEKGVNDTIVNGIKVEGGTTVIGEKPVSGGGGGSSNGEPAKPDVSVEVNGFKKAHERALNLGINSVTIADKEKVEEAILALDKLSDEAKITLAEEKHKLNSLLKCIEILEQVEEEGDNPAVSGDDEYIPSDEV